MSRDASISLVWGDGEHRFRLAIGELRELEEKRKAGPVQIAERLTGLYDMFGNTRLPRRLAVDDIRETIRLGLIGGGMAPHEAVTLVDGYLERWPLLRSAGVAAQVLDAALSGRPDEPVGKRSGGRGEEGLSFVRIYETGAGLFNWPAETVDRMSLWQVRRGRRRLAKRVNAADDEDAMTVEQLQQMNPPATMH